ncbi:hypothetical protein HA402_005347 [Bradysia odoriphaga]|nr:hypothetical protein HA402_005347 [Bradysia odoriphaga]
MDIDVLANQRKRIQSVLGDVDGWMGSLSDEKARLERHNFYRLEGKEEYDKTVNKWKKVRRARDYFNDTYEGEYWKVMQAYKDGDKKLYEKLTDIGLLNTHLLLKYLMKHLQKITDLYVRLESYI